MSQHETLTTPRVFRSNRLWTLIHVLICGLFVLGLWRAGYPAWRTAAVGAILLGKSLHNLIFSHLLQPVRAIEESEAWPRKGIGAWVFGVVTIFMVVGLTGGLRSPFLISTMTPITGMLITSGWSRPSKLVMRLVVLGAVLLVILPAAWVGPVVAEPHYSQLAALVLLSVVLLHGTYLIAMTHALNESHCKAGRTRDLMAQQALSRARELEQMSAQLSHELKNPLSAIKALVQLAKHDACDDTSRERLQVAESEVERMNCILQEYLSFSRPMDKLRREPLRLGALADEVVELLSAQAAAAGVALRRSGEAALEADPRRLREAFFNLVANALDATPHGGSVEVRISQRGAAVEVEVRDSGRGMPREILDRVGTPFFTTREQGTGLGVAMARAAFTQHGGSLAYASEEGRGTIATGTLPLWQERRDGGPAAPG